MHTYVVLFVYESIIFVVYINGWHYNDSFECTQTFINEYMHACIHTYIHTCTYSYMHTAHRHPDDPVAHSKFQKIGEAYQVLSDESLRASYDAGGVEGVEGI